MILMKVKEGALLIIQTSRKPLIASITAYLSFRGLLCFGLIKSLKPRENNTFQEKKCLHY